MIVFVEHYLTPEGRAYFPNWIEAVRDAVSSFPGYHSLTEMVDVERPDRCLLLLNFNTLQDLRKWGGSEAHSIVLARIQPFQTRKQFSQLLEPRA